MVGVPLFTAGARNQIRMDLFAKVVDYVLTGVSTLHQI